jgi:hypothetical protein
MKTKVMLLIVVLSLSLLIPGSITKSVASENDIEYGKMAKYLPSNGEMYGWIKDLWKIGVQGEYGYRMPGTSADLMGRDYVLKKFQDFGLKNTFLEPVPATFSFPDTWKLEVNGKQMPCYFLRYAGFTPAQGITAPMVYVGEGSDAEFAAAGDVTGKIVVVDIIAPPTPASAFPPVTIFKYDPDNTLVGDNAMENWPPTNFTSYDTARAKGAAGYVAILTFTVNDNNQHLHYYFDGSIPGVSVSPTDGANLRSLIASGPVEAKLTLTGSNGAGSISNVYGTIPGKNYGTPADQFIVVESHYDGWACNEASGTSVALALAKYYSQFPKETRNYSILFCEFGSHFGKKLEWNMYSNYAYGLVQQHRVKFAAVIEMISKQFKIIDGQYVDTGLVSPRGLMTTQYTPLALPPSVLQAAKDALVKYDFERTLILHHYFNGEALRWSSLVPTIGHISENAPQFTSADTPNTVMVDALRPTTAVFIDIINAAETSF